MLDVITNNTSGSGTPLYLNKEAYMCEVFGASHFLILAAKDTDVYRSDFPFSSKNEINKSHQEMKNRVKAFQI